MLLLSATAAFMQKGRPFERPFCWSGGA